MADRSCVSRARYALVAMLMAAACGPSGERTRIGEFDLYMQTGGTAGGRVSRSLYYRRRLLTNRFGASALDPMNPGRILFSGDTEFNSEKDPCGTFLFDAATGGQEKVAAWPDGLGAWTWSPDGRKLLLLGSAGMYPEVLDLSTRESVPLASAMSQNGEQLELRAIGWSPDSQRVAAVVHLTRDAQANRAQDWDLVEITLTPLAAAYVATMQAASVTWDPTEYRWQDGRLTSVGAGRRFPIIRKADGEVGWTPIPPDSVTRSPASPCSQ